MNELKCTPGPWHVPEPMIRDQGGLSFTPIFASTLIAKVYSTSFEDYEQSMANAYMMAAAKDLYDALEEVVAISDRDHAAWDRAKAALAKARNEGAGL